MLLSLGGYYLWTLTSARGPPRRPRPPLGSVLFVGYEMLGFGGLGPGRLALRSAGPAALRPYLVWLALYAVLIAILIGAALRRLVKGGNRRHLAVAFCCCLPAAFLLASVGWCISGCWGGISPRSFPSCCFSLPWAAPSLWARRSAWARGVVLLFCALSLVSCLSLRFLARHEKDNYRAAAAAPRPHCATASPFGGMPRQKGRVYYGVPMSPRPAAAARRCCL